jgi:hypothetical protein
MQWQEGRFKIAIRSGHVALSVNSHRYCVRTETCWRKLAIAYAETPPRVPRSAARVERFRGFGQPPCFGIIALLEGNRQQSNFSHRQRTHAARELAQKRSIAPKCCKVGSKVEAIPCFNFALPKKIHLFRDARS